MAKIVNKHTTKPIVAGGILTLALATVTLATALVNALTVNNIVPVTGPTTGQIVTINGSGFQPDTPTFQNFGADKCASMEIYNTTNPGALLVLTDSRDIRTYTIGKLADGNCWMLDNLRLGSTSSTITLTNADTDLNTKMSFTLPQLTTSSPTDNDNPGVYGPIPGDTGSDATNYGYLYNWSATTAGESRVTIPAGSGNAPNSICPLGWRLPTNDGTWDGGISGSDFARLNGAMYSGTTTSSNYYDMDHANNFYFDSPFRSVFSGAWIGYFTSQTTSGNYWSSTADTGTSYYVSGLAINTFSVNTGLLNHRYYGLSIRCLARTATTDTNHYDSKPYVTVDGVAIDPDDVEVVSGTELRIKMPAHMAGIVNVSIALGAETRTVQYEYVEAAIPGPPDTGIWIKN